MKIVSKENQTVFDIAVQYYGDCSLFDRVLLDNPHLVNDYTEAHNAGINVDYSVFDIAWPLAAGQVIQIDPLLVNRSVLRELGGIEVISFNKIDLI